MEDDRRGREVDDEPRAGSRHTAGSNKLPTRLEAISIHGRLHERDIRYPRSDQFVMGRKPPRTKRKTPCLSRVVVRFGPSHRASVTDLRWLVLRRMLLLAPAHACMHRSLSARNTDGKTQRLRDSQRRCLTNGLNGV